MNRPRVFPDSCVLIEGLVAPGSACRGVLILGRAALFTFVLAEIVIAETERALVRKLGAGYGAWGHLEHDLRLLLGKLNAERVPHVSRQEFESARKLIRHANDAPVLAAAMKARPDWFLTDNSDHFSAAVARQAGLRIATPAEFLERSGRILAG